MLLQYRTYRLICVNKVFVQIKLIPPSPFFFSFGYKDFLTQYVSFKELSLSLFNVKREIFLIYALVKSFGVLSFPIMVYFATRWMLIISVWSTNTLSFKAGTDLF